MVDGRVYKVGIEYGDSSFFKNEILVFMFVFVFISSDYKLVIIIVLLEGKFLLIKDSVECVI